MQHVNKQIQRSGDIRGVNPEILLWARETAGLTKKEAAKKIGLRDTNFSSAASHLNALENGTRKPTRSQLFKMAKHYHRALLIFYLDNPPKPAKPGVDFRSLPTNYEDSSSKFLDVLLRDLRVRQSMVKAVLEDEDETKRLSFVGAKKMHEGKSAVLQYLQELLNVSREQYRSNSNPEKAFSMLRNAVEKLGIFVLLQSNLGSYHTKINLEVYRGFVIADSIAPFIVINNQDAVPARSFTLLHELVHLLLVIQESVGYQAAMSMKNSAMMSLAVFFLSPDELGILDFKDSTDIKTKVDQISKFASARHLSRTMVTNAACREGLIGPDTYSEISQMFRAQWLRTRQIRSEKSGFAPPTVVRPYSLGNNLIELIRRTTNDGSLTTTKAARILGVKPQQVQPIVATTL